MENIQKVWWTFGLFVAYALIPVLINRIFFDNNLYFTGFHAAISEIGVALISGAYVYKSRKGLLKIDYLLPFSFLALAIADVLYSFTANIPFDSPEKSLLVYIREPTYLAFVIGITTYIAVKLKDKIFDKFSIMLSISVAFLFLLLSLKYKILLYRKEHLGVYFIAISWGYGIIKCVLQGLLASAILRTNRLHSLLLFQSLFLMFVADFALEYQMNSVNYSIQSSSFFNHSWEISAATILILYFQNFRNPDFLSDNMVNFPSLRSSISVAFYIIIAALYTVLILFGMNIHNALELTNLLMVSYFIFFMANLFSLSISNKFMSITELLKKNRLFNLSEAGKGFLFSRVHENAHLSEVDYFIHEYNLISENANALLKAYIDQSRYAVIGQTAQMLAHDVRKPFSQLQAILEHFDTCSVEDRRKAKEEVKKSIKNVESMISDIMDFSREVQLETQPVSLGSVLDFSIRQSSMAFPRQDSIPAIHFEYALHHACKPLMDEERMARVFSNILGNALEAITVIGKKDTGKIWIHSREYQKNGSSGPWGEIVFGNDGPPFQEEDIPKLFNSFFTKGKKKGTGLGLASVEKIVRLHGGEVCARNAIERLGVEFVLTLPLSGETESASTGLPQCLCEILRFADLPDKSHSGTEEETGRDDEARWLEAVKKLGSPIKVLLLEDETLYRAAVKNVLAAHDDFRSSIVFYDANTVEAALALLKQEPEIHYAIVDIDLGQMQNGFDFLREAKERYPRLKSMVHTNRCVKEDKVLAKVMGAVAFVSKPLNFETLASFLANHLPEPAHSLPGQLGQPIGGVLRGPHASGPAQYFLCYVADDSAIMRMTLKKHLSALLGQTTIRVFKDPEEMLEAARDAAPDLVLSDFNFDHSVMTGADALSQMKELYSGAHLFLVSNISEEEAVPLVKELGLSGFIRPSFNIQEQLAQLLSVNAPLPAGAILAATLLIFT